MAKEKSAVLILLFAIVVIVVLTTMITMQVAEKAVPASKELKTVTAQGKVSFTILPSEQTTTPAVASATGSVTFNILNK